MGVDVMSIQEGPDPANYNCALAAMAGTMNTEQPNTGDSGHTSPTPDDHSFLYGRDALPTRLRVPATPYSRRFDLLERMRKTLKYYHTMIEGIPEDLRGLIWKITCKTG